MADMKNLGGMVGAMPAKKLITLLAALVMAVAAVMLVYSWSRNADYQLLYANLSPEDAGQLIQKLGEMRIPYRTEAGGIMVPSDKVYELRLQLASQGLPQGGGVGFELFDKTSFTMTDFVQKLNYRRAVQGELARSIRALREVEQCRVHLVVPEKSLFAQRQDRPKASVLVKLRPGRRLSPGQVRGVVHLVSSSVEGLDSNDVTVVDSAGEMLTAPADTALAATTGQMEYQHGYEKELEGRIIGILEPVAGKGKVRVKTAATMDFTRIEKTEERYDPDGQVIRSEQRNIDQSSNTTASEGGGVPGVSSNLPDKAEQDDAEETSQTRSTSSVRKNETVNYEISKTVSHVVNPAVELKRLSVIALVDGTYTAQQGSQDKKYTPRTEEDLRQFEEMVKKAVGFNAERGDEVKVINMQFEAAAQDEMGALPEEPAPSMLPSVMSFAKYLVPLAAIILVFVFVVKPLMRMATGPSPAMQGRLPGGPIALPQSVAEIEQAMQRQELSPRDQLVTWAKQNPKDATNLVKGWLEEK